LRICGIDKWPGDPRHLWVNLKSLARNQPVGHCQTVAPGEGKVYRDHPWFGSKGDGLKLYFLPIDQPVAQALERKRKAKPGESLPRLDFNILRPSLQVFPMRFLRGGPFPTEVHSKGASRFSVAHFPPGPLFLDKVRPLAEGRLFLGAPSVGEIER